MALRFAVPPHEADGTAFFLRSRGYYYEWIRQAWLRDEDLDEARTYLADPDRAFRELAPAYRVAEPHMEAIFRASRFERTEAP